MSKKKITKNGPPQHTHTHKHMASLSNCAARIFYIHTHTHTHTHLHTHTHTCIHTHTQTRTHTHLHTHTHTHTPAWRLSRPVPPAFCHGAASVQSRSLQLYIICELINYYHNIFDSTGVASLIPKGLPL